MQSSLLIAPLVALLVSVSAFASGEPPQCRLDKSHDDVVDATLRRALHAYKLIGKSLPIVELKINPNQTSAKDGVLSVYVVKDANKGATDINGCAQVARRELPLDDISVRGGCYVVAEHGLEIRCSSDAVKIFSDVGKRHERANPSFFYVLAHELAHIYQQRYGEYSGRVSRVALNADKATKLSTLRRACEPLMIRQEEEADELAFEVLRSSLSSAPYRETAFSERGSLYWNIDQLALAAEAWEKHAVEQDFNSQPKLHSSFVPTEFPTPKRTINVNANKFVCDVLKKSKGVVIYPDRSSSHPSMEQRLRRIVEILKPLADQLPTGGGQDEFKPIARLQQDLSPIFSHIYRETGIYMEKVHAEICTVINSPNPESVCK